MLNANESKHIWELSQAKLSKTTFWDETQSASIIKMFQDSSHSILEGVKNVVRLQHTSKKFYHFKIPIKTFKDLMNFSTTFS
jgi:hypothetical protein